MPTTPGETAVAGAARHGRGVFRSRDANGHAAVRRPRRALGSAVAHAFHGVPNTRVVILYPDGRVSPTQEAQLTMFNGEQSNVRAYAVAGSFDDCHKLTREAYADPDLRRSMRLTSANSVNVGRLLPQSVYYFPAIAQLG